MIRPTIVKPLVTGRRITVIQPSRQLPGIIETMPRSSTVIARVLAIGLLSLITGMTMSMAGATGGSREWRFNVLLDGKPIGHHYFTLVENDGRRDLKSEARFTVKILFVTAYRYVHDSREIFQGDCLEKIEARTDDNGKDLAVSGALEERGFMLSSHDAAHPACIMTFAYWNPNMLGQTRLLNAQNGKYEPVSIRKVGEETLTVRGKATPAQHYFVAGDKLKIDLWYSADSEWVGLKSTTEDGRQLLYQLQ
jgi:hypothetical protein